MHLVKHTPRALRLLPAQVRLAAFSAHNLARAGDLEAARGLLVCFHLRHTDVLFPVIPRGPTAPCQGAVSQRISQVDRPNREMKTRLRAKYSERLRIVFRIVRFAFVVCNVVHG